MHFGPTFKGWQEARNHFGDNVRGDAFCQYTSTQVRAMEHLLRSYQEEDTPRDRHLAQIQSEHATALRREEEKGYQRGLKNYHELATVVYEQCSREGCHCPGEIKDECAFCLMSIALAGYFSSNPGAK